MTRRAGLLKAACMLAGMFQVACHAEHVKEVAASAWVTLGPGLSINHEEREVRIRSWSCLDQGFLEQVLCSPGTREHEALLVTDVPASSIHAALLLVGIEPGRPGRWHEDGGRVQLLAPLGDGVSVLVKYRQPGRGEAVEEPVSRWITDLQAHGSFPTETWIFGGSILLEEEESIGQESRYLADHTGSLIGIVTFGDEMLGAPRVIPDAASLQEPEWVVRVEHVPPVGTEVQVILAPGVVPQPAPGKEESEEESEG